MTAARRLGAIHAVDVVGYSRPMGKDEERTVQPHRAGSKERHGRTRLPFSLIVPAACARRVQAPAQQPLTLCAERDAKTTIFWGFDATSVLAMNAGPYLGGNGG